MKFGKLLKDQISEVPNELKPKFLSYKELKKQLKGISPGTPANTWENESHEGHEGETCCGKSKSAERAEGGREVEREREKRWRRRTRREQRGRKNRWRWRWRRRRRRRRRRQKSKRRASERERDCEEG